MDYVVLLDSSGKYRGLRNLRDKDEKSKREIGKQFLVPNIGKQVFKHTNAGNDPNLLWDNASFALGIGKNGEKKLRCFHKELIRWMPESVVCGPLAPLDIFLKTLLADESAREGILADSAAGEEIHLGLANISFALEGDAVTWLEHPSVKAEFEKNFQALADGGAILGTCLITGQKRVPLERTHPVVKGMKSKDDPNFLSFNKPSFRSYGKEQGLNAPSGKDAVRGYTAALNDLLRDGSRHVVRFGKLATLFWTDGVDPFENAFAELLGITHSQSPSRGVGNMKQVLESLYSGQYAVSGDRLFFILGLEAMGPRLAVRSWQRGTVSKVSSSLQAWFKDLELIGLDPTKGTLALRQLLQSIAPHTKSKPFGDGDRVPPSLEPQLMECALAPGQVFPRYVLVHCINRIRAESALDIKNKDFVLSQRVALLKAYLNRTHRIKPFDEKEITVSLDPTNTSPGYILGRIFALLERIQLASNNYQEVNAGIRDRFYGSFSSSPTTTYPLLDKLKIHHLRKIERKGEAVRLERMLGEIVDLLPSQGPPSHLRLEEQARFAIGYYHQRQALFTKTAKPDSSQA